jgi:Flp pilus assembly protein TadG
MDINQQRTGIYDRGSAMVEMVFILPILCVMIFAIAEFGIAFGRWQALNNAAREGARTAIVYRQPCVEADVVTEVSARVTDYAALIGLTAADLTFYQLDNFCGAAGTDATVDASAPYTFAILPGFSPSVSSSITLTGRSIMRNEG